MRKRTIAVSIVISLGLGLGIAYAKRPAGKSKQVPRAQRKAAVGRVAMPAAPADMKTVAELRQKAWQEFANRKNEGTRVWIHPDVKGDNLALQMKVAAAFRELNFCPEARSAHFAWLKNAPSMRWRGWNANFKSIVPSKDGWLVTMVFFPVVDSMDAQKEMLVGDSLIEKYIYDGNLHFLGSEALPPSPISWAIN